MKLVALIMVTLAWIISASLRQGPERKPEGAWLDELAVSSSGAVSPVAPPRPSPSLPPAQTKTQAEPRRLGSGSPWVGTVVCRRVGEPERTLTLSRREGRYELVYARLGASETVAWSQWSIRTCEEVRKRIRRKLESAGFRCEPQAKSG